MNLVLDFRLTEKNHAGFKARIDAIKILEKRNFEHYSIPIEKNIIGIFSIIYKLVKLLLQKDINVIVVQYPLINNILVSIILLILHCKKVTTICLIHDVNSLRHDLSDKEILREINIFNKFSYIISHNSNMTNWLKSKGLKVKTYELDVFDYLARNNKKKNFSINGYSIVFATGCLGDEKSEFLKEACKTLNSKFNLYGNIDKDFYKILQNENKVFNYCGAVSPNDITEKIEGHFGLVWDGLSINECTGTFGRYTMYNNPHKLSMYLAAGLPVIVWKKSAIASFVQKNKIGFTINNLYEIDETLKKMNDLEYEDMVINVQNISKKIKSGQYLDNVIKDILKIDSSLEMTLE